MQLSVTSSYTLFSLGCRARPVINSAPFVRLRNIRDNQKTAARETTYRLYRSFFFIRMLFFRPGLNILIFPPFLAKIILVLFFKKERIYYGLLLFMSFVLYKNVLHVPFTKLSLAFGYSYSKHPHIRTNELRTSG